jgi:hypothetical protein
MKSLILLFLLAISFQCNAENNEEMWLGAALIVTDWSTTRNMASRYNEGFIEEGPVLNMLFGNRPSKKEINLYFITRLAIHYAIYKSDLSDSKKEIYYYLTIADHGFMTANNLSIGLKIKF